MNVVSITITDERVDEIDVDFIGLSEILVNITFRKKDINDLRKIIAKLEALKY